MSAIVAAKNRDQVRLNLKDVGALLVDRSSFTRSLHGRMLRAFGCNNVLMTGTGYEAKELIQTNAPDICLVEGSLPDMPTVELVNWIRRRTTNMRRYTPIVVLSGYAQMRFIAAVRDSGANIVVCKPVSPQVLFDRLNWVARAGRPFIETATYVGPDRRFHSIIPPDGKLKRSSDIVSEEIGII